MVRDEIWGNPVEKTLPRSENREWLENNFRKTDKQKAKRGRKKVIDYFGPYIVAGIVAGLGFLIYEVVTPANPAQNDVRPSPIVAPVDSLEAATADTSGINTYPLLLGMTAGPANAGYFPR